MKARDRERFDALVEEVIASLPDRWWGVIERVPVVVLDRPDASVLRDMGMNEDEADELCGLHTGVSQTERSIEDPTLLPSEIQLYREGIVAEAGGWHDSDAVRQQIRITLLHELGHELGLDEDDLDELGYQ